MKAIVSHEYKTILSQLKRERVAKGISQAELSSKLGHSQSYISKVEHGQIRLDIIQLKEIANHLALDIRKLME